MDTRFSVSTTKPNLIFTASHLNICKLLATKSRTTENLCLFESAHATCLFSSVHGRYAQRRAFALHSGVLLQCAVALLRM